MAEIIVTTKSELENLIQNCVRQALSEHTPSTNETANDILSRGVSEFSKTNALRVYLEK